VREESHKRFLLWNKPESVSGDKNMIDRGALCGVHGIAVLDVPDLTGV